MFYMSFMLNLGLESWILLLLLGEKSFNNIVLTLKFYMVAYFKALLTCIILFIFVVIIVMIFWMKKLD